MRSLAASSRFLLQPVRKPKKRRDEVLFSLLDKVVFDEQRVVAAPVGVVACRRYRPALEMLGLEARVLRGAAPCVPYPTSTALLRRIPP
jgi:hypothetical protein